MVFLRRVTQGALRLAQREGDRAEGSLRISQGALQLAQREGDRAENNLRLSLDAFGDVFDALVGRDPVLDFEEDPGTGEETVVVQSTVSQSDVVLLQEMLAFYDRFATANADSESLRYETARARRRVGAIHAQLGNPTSLETAQAAFEKALAGFQTISDRDVRRDVADVQVDLGKLCERQGRTGEARKHFEAALALLAKLPGADSAAGRLLRAEILFERYRTHDRFRWRREGPWGSADFCAAMALLGELMRSDGSNPDVRALTARCLREEARGPGGHAVEAEVLEIFRALAREHPDRLEFRSEFCKAVLARARRPRVPRRAIVALAARYSRTCKKPSGWPRTSSPSSRCFGSPAPYSCRSARGAPACSTARPLVSTRRRFRRASGWRTRPSALR